MLGTLTDMEIEKVLREHLVGRIGCCNDGRAYVVPISYAYDREYVYGITNEGLKLKMMRNNPNVCFQVDELHDMGNWKSVIAWGEFEELDDVEERNEGIKILTDRNLTLISSVTTHSAPTWPFVNADNIKGIVFRIKLYEKTGRYESNDLEPLFSL